MQLRTYQQTAVERTWQHLRTQSDNPCVVIPTGGGKTPCIAALAHDCVLRDNRRLVIATHVKELIQQSAATIHRYEPTLDVGIYSAGLNRRDLEHDVLICGIQSVYQRAHELGRRHLLIVDECHLIPDDGAGMYRSFINDLGRINNGLRVVGMTATPYRTSSGLLCRPDGIVNRVCYQAQIIDLIRQGYLCEVVNAQTQTEIDTERATVRAGEFVNRDIEAAATARGVVEASCEEIIAATHNRVAVLIFTTSIRHGEQVTNTLQTMGVDADFVSSQSLPIERESIINRFRSGDLKYLVNVNVLTTGFDAPHVDCVAVLRPTMSAGLFYQMVGRGFRIEEGKQNCLLLDFGGNLQRHGALDDPQFGRTRASEGNGQGRTKECPNCQLKLPAGRAQCECGFLFPRAPRQESEHEQQADQDSPVLLGLQDVPDPEWKEVTGISYSKHTKQGKPDSLRVTYEIEGNLDTVSEWILILHDHPWCRSRAVNWWKCRSEHPLPTDIDAAVYLCNRGGIADTKRVLVGPDPKNPRFNQITDYVLDEIPHVGDLFEVNDEWEEVEAPF